MLQHQVIFENVRKHPSLYVGDVTYDAVVAFVNGYDCACEGGTLRGFREWLLVRLDRREMDNLAWSGLVLELPGVKGDREALNSFSAHRAIDTLFDLISEFDEARASSDGLRGIFVTYTKWLRDTKVEG